MVFIPMCFVFGLSVDVKNKVPSIIWEVELFLPELTSENLGDSHVLRKLGGRVLIGFTRMWLGPIVLCVFDTQFPQTQIHISQNRDLNALELPSKMEAQIIPGSQKAPRPQPPTLWLSFYWSAGSFISGTYGSTFPPFPWWSRSWFSQQSLYSFSRYSSATRGIESACEVGPLAAQASEGVCTVHFAHTTGEKADIQNITSPIKALRSLDMKNS